MTKEKTEDLKLLRKKIDKIDSIIILLIAERFKITRKIGKFKKKNKLPSLDKKREDEIYKNLKEKAIKRKIDSKMLQDIWKVLMNQSKKEQREN